MRRFWCLLVLGISAGAAGAQEPMLRVGGDPAQVVRAFLDAVAATRWREAAAFLDLQPLEQQRSELLRWQRQPLRQPELTVEDFMRMDPKMPRAVAEYNVEQAKQHQSFADGYPFTSTFAGVPDTITLMRLTLEELGARWLEARDGRYAMRQALHLSPTCSDVPDSLLFRRMPRRVVVGAIERGDTAYVLYKDSTRASRRRDDSPRSDPLTVTLRRREGTWRIVPREMLLGGENAMSLFCQPAPGDSSRAGRPPPA